METVRITIVFIPKYRKKALYGNIKNDVREIIATLCKYKDVDIIAGAVCIDHVHLSVAIPPKLSISEFMGYLKGKSTLMVYDRHPELQSKWDKAVLSEYIRKNPCAGVQIPQEIKTESRRRLSRLPVIRCDIHMLQDVMRME